MVAAQPVTIFNQIVRRVFALLSVANPDDFTLRQVDRDIAKLKNADPFGAMELAAVMHGIRGDVETMVATFERAIAGTAHKGHAIFRMLDALKLLTDGSAMAALFSKYHPIFRNDALILRRIESSMSGAGWFEHNSVINQDLSRVGAETLDVVPTEQVLRAFALTEQDVQAAVGFANLFLRRRGIFPVRRVLKLVRNLEPGPSPQLLLRFYAYGEIENLVEAEFDLFDGLYTADLRAHRTGALVLCVQPESQPANSGDHDRETDCADPSA
ncbi:MAG: hypothetical protein U0S76_12270 [Pseudoxanthomonas sp.]|nr:hypothetical protein [Pseudoxanthomonas sp.]